jgi:hypothetical protein
MLNSAPLDVAGSRQTPASVRLDDGAHDGKPQSHALRLRREEGLEDAVAVFRRDAGTRIAHADLRAPVLHARLHAHFALALRRACGRVDRVDGQVGDGLPDLHRIPPSRQEGRRRGA